MSDQPDNDKGKGLLVHGDVESDDDNQSIPSHDESVGIQVYEDVGPSGGRTQRILVRHTRQHRPSPAPTQAHEDSRPPSPTSSQATLPGAPSSSSTPAPARPPVSLTRPKTITLGGSVKAKLQARTDAIIRLSAPLKRPLPPAAAGKKPPVPEYLKKLRSYSRSKPGAPPPIPSGACPACRNRGWLSMGHSHGRSTFCPFNPKGYFRGLGIPDRKGRMPALPWDESRTCKIALI